MLQNPVAGTARPARHLGPRGFRDHPLPVHKYSQWWYTFEAALRVLHHSSRSRLPAGVHRGSPFHAQAGCHRSSLVIDRGPHRCGGALRVFFRAVFSEAERACKGLVGGSETARPHHFLRVGILGAGPRACVSSNLGRDFGREPKGPGAQNFLGGLGPPPARGKTQGGFFKGPPPPRV